MDDNAVMPLSLWRHVYATERTQNRERQTERHRIWQVHYIIHLRGKDTQKL